MLARVELQRGAHSSMMEYLHYVGLGLATILPVANPLTSATLLLALGADFTAAERNQQIDKATLYVAAIIGLCFYGGHAIMTGLGISIPGLRIAGGIIVAYIGFTMLFPGASRSEADAQAGMKVADLKTHKSALRRKTPRDIAFVPLALPGTAGPGTIAVIISAAATIHSHGGATPVQHLSFLTVGAIIVVLFWACLRGANRVVAILGESGIDAISRVMGFLLVCIGVQFVIDGIFELFELRARLS
jgi:multiple antibiotic resistance protein